MKSSEFLSPDQVPKLLFRITTPDQLKFNKNGLLIPHNPWNPMYRFYVPMANLEDIDKVTRMFYSMSLFTVIKHPELLVLMIDSSYLRRIKHRDFSKTFIHGEFLAEIPKQSIRRVDAYNVTGNPNTGDVDLKYKEKRELD